MPSTDGKWQVVSASVRGASHQRQHVACQDAHAVRVLRDEIVVASIADGAGSAERAREGARAARTAALRRLVRGSNSDPADWPSVVAQAFGYARQAVTDLATACNQSVALFHTTLACAIVNHDRLVAAQIGDGVVVGQHEAETPFTILVPQRGEYANDTVFLTVPRALDQLEVKTVCGRVRGLALSTDGLLDVITDYPHHSPHEGVAERFFAFASSTERTPANARRTLRHWLASEQVRKAARGDDMTLVLIARRPAC